MNVRYSIVSGFALDDSGQDSGLGNMTEEMVERWFQMQLMLRLGQIHLDG